jgi:hypothetical protein
VKKKKNLEMDLVKMVFYDHHEGERERENEFLEPSDGAVYLVQASYSQQSPPSRVPFHDDGEFSYLFHHRLPFIVVFI